MRERILADLLLQLAHHTGRDRLVEQREDLGAVGLLDLRERRETKPRADDRRQRQQVGDRGRQGLEAPANRLADAIGQR